MKRIWMSSLGMLLLAGSAGSARAQTFEPASLSQDLSVEVFTRDEARQHFDRDLFSQPWATVVIGRVDVYDRFPYLEARYFQVVSDPGWNRLVFGETDRGLAAYDGRGSAFGELSQPRGMAVDEAGRLYLADSGNDRVLVFQTSSEFDQLELQPLYAIGDLARPHDVAHSDAGTPNDPTDDLLYVAETGANAVARVELGADSARVTSRLGALGSGAGRFAGPMAITVGREDGHDNDIVYVADAHSGRLVRLNDDAGELTWLDALDDTGAGIRDLDTDEFGQLYAASPEMGQIQKYTADLLPIATSSGDLSQPRSVHIPQVEVHDHVRNVVERSRRGSAMVMDTWGADTGLHLYDLGVEIRDAHLADGNRAEFELSDRSELSLRLYSSQGEFLDRRDLGWKAAGVQTIDASELTAGREPGSYRLELTAVSAQNADRSAHASLALSSDGGGVPRIDEPMALGATPNPFNPNTNIEFVVPAGALLSYQLDIVDLRGRVVRHLDAGTASSGVNRVLWNGQDDAGRSVASGVYLYRLDLDGELHSGKLALVK